MFIGNISWIFQTLITFLFTLILIDRFKRFAYDLGWIDRPGAHKHHIDSIPLVGGVAMVVAFTVSLLTLEAFEILPVSYYVLLGNVILLTIIGVYDDLRSLSPYSRLIVQVVTGVTMITLGEVYLIDLGDLIGGGLVKLQDWSIPLTVLCAIGVINALNMIDGVDGLAGGVALITIVWLITLALVSGSHSLEIMVLGLLASVIAGFLCFNLRCPWRRKASVFMGDAGSTVLGFLLLWFLVDFSQGEQRLYEPVIALWLLGLPLMDTVTIMLRRLFKGQSPFKADRQHLHHLLLMAGYSDAQTTALLLAFSAFLGAIGFVGWYWAVPGYLLLYGFLALFAGYYLALHQAWRMMTRRSKSRAEEPSRAGVPLREAR